MTDLSQSATRHDSCAAPQDPRPARGMIHPLPKLIYQMLCKLLSWMIPDARADAAEDIEILVLRHQLALLQRRTQRPRLHWTIAPSSSPRRLGPAALRRQHTAARDCRIVTPATILRSHRQLATRR